jgi:hypothetical protein
MDGNFGDVHKVAKSANALVESGARCTLLASKHRTSNDADRVLVAVDLNSPSRVASVRVQGGNGRSDCNGGRRIC